MTDWVGPAIEAAGVVVAALIAAWATLRYRRWAEQRKREIAERKLAERRRIEELRKEQSDRELELRRQQLQWQQATDLAKGAAWVVDRLLQNPDEGEEEDEDA